MVPPVDGHIGRRQVGACDLQRAHDGSGHQHAQAESCHGGHDAHCEGLERHRLGQLKPAGPQHPQQSQLLDALAHDQMERVVGDERRDDQHDDGERQQLVAEEVRDLVELRFALIGLVLLGEDLDGGAQGALDGRDHRLQRGARRQPHIDAVVAPAAVQELPSRSHVPGDLLEREPVVGFQEVVVADPTRRSGCRWEWRPGSARRSGSRGQWRCGGPW